LNAVTVCNRQGHDGVISMARDEIEPLQRRREDSNGSYIALDRR
jgi:hypothetical protein